MTDRTPDEIARKHWELMMRVARRPGFCCCCIWIPHSDRRRARRIFRLARAVARSWEQPAERSPRKVKRRPAR
jgi:hypothetical protein